MTLLLTLLATVLAVLAEGRYIVSIFQGKTKPSFSGWLLFTTSMICIFISSYSLGARESLYLVGTFTLLNASIALLALKYGFIKFHRLEIILFILTFIGIFLWWYFSSPWYTLVISVLIDMFGYIIMVKKLYLYPETEDKWSWAMSVGAYSLNLIIISHWIPQEYLFSLSNVVWCSIIFLLALRQIPRVRRLTPASLSPF